MTWQPTWRRLIATTAIMFVLLLALLAWRLQTGHDPALRAATTTAVTASSAATSDDASAATDDGTTAAIPSTHAS
jgi:hypothetical protein